MPPAGSGGNWRKGLLTASPRTIPPVHHDRIAAGKLFVNSLGGIGGLITSVVAAKEAGPSSWPWMPASAGMSGRTRVLGWRFSKSKVLRRRLGG